MNKQARATPVAEILPVADPARSISTACCTPVVQCTASTRCRRGHSVVGMTKNRMLWLTLAVAAVLNAALSTVNPFLGAGFGVVVLACAGTLILRHYRRS
jgi:hypothetical protein